MLAALEALRNAIYGGTHRIRAPVSIEVMDALAARHVRGGAYVNSVNKFLRHLNQIKSETQQEKNFIQLASSIQITNAYLGSRKSICMRLNPAVIFPSADDIPHSVFYMHDPELFSGFHVRFRPVARGGLRVVTNTKSTTSSILKECYALAQAQHLKNKDIPESGSKAVLLLHNHHENKDQSVLSAVDGLLDCTLPHPDIMHAEYTDHLYLGPDEQITPTNIENIVALAKERGHLAPRTFMTSKIKTGFNHKALGVTSEGVEVFMYALMRKMFFPRTAGFTVKITGGPDGDVAGNLLRILYREYGEFCKVVGIADGTAVCEDPNGISWHYLLNLVRSNKPLSEFQVSRATTKLVKCVDADSNHLRDTMHERVIADVFIPAGGRPFTVNDTNYSRVGTTTKLVVEGANLFLTAAARDKICAEYKVPIIKDSSANKGGVCCSSMEVLASMLLTEEEIILNKDSLDDSVLKYIRYLARIEADSLLEHYPARRDLHRISEEMSRKIIARKDELYTSYCKLSHEYVFEDLDRFMRPYLPHTLVHLGWHRARTNIPIDYARMMISAFRASREIYGLTF